MNAIRSFATRSLAGHAGCIALIVGFGLLAHRPAAEAAPSVSARADEASLDDDGISAEEQFQRARMYFNGTGVAQDQAKAVALLRRAAERGAPRAQSELGALYAEGSIVGADDAIAVYWFRKAALSGLADGQLNLGLAYVNGLGVPRDYAEAVKWFLLAAGQGNAEAEFDLGVAYARGDGVGMSPFEARRWFSLAAKQGYLPAKEVLDSNRSPRIGQ